jgi:methionyl-tRNA formyltransferase
MAFNIHGSLLPKYRGRTPHVWAIINNEKETGITAHKIDRDCDTGDIIRQIKIEIEENDTGASILAKYESLYLSLIESVLSDIKSNKVNAVRQDHTMATYFGKRTPEDGRIDWNWQKERIRNWVRAQADPYPGAFTFYEQSKIIIDEVMFSSRAYSSDMPNGMILSLDPLEIKTPNGAIRILKMRSNEIKMDLTKCFK